MVFNMLTGGAGFCTMDFKFFVLTCCKVGGNSCFMLQCDFLYQQFLPFLWDDQKQNERGTKV